MSVEDREPFGPLLLADPHVVEGLTQGGLTVDPLDRRHRDPCLVRKGTERAPKKVPCDPLSYGPGTSEGAGLEFVNCHVHIARHCSARVGPDAMPFKVRRNDRAKFELDEFLSRPLLAHLSTASDLGARNSVFWYLWEDEALWMILEEGYNSVQARVRDDPRVALGIVDFDPKSGFLQHVSIRGHASLEPWDDGRAGRLLRRYYARLEGYSGTPHKSGERTWGSLPMILLKVLPESVLMREQGYRDLVLLRQNSHAQSARSIESPSFSAKDRGPRTSK